MPLIIVTTIVCGPNSARSVGQQVAHLVRLHGQQHRVLRARLGACCTARTLAACSSRPSSSSSRKPRR
jgi:hypothetical protein